MNGRRAAVLGAVAALAGVAALAVFLQRKQSAPPLRFRPRAVAGQDLVLQPESERAFSRVVIGLRPHGASGKNPLRGTTDPRLIALRRRLYGLDFELFHGQCMTAVPKYATFF